jgi:DNA-binding transcriptional LysR family regulator
MCRMVQARLGITMLPEAVLQQHAEAGLLRIVKLNEDWAQRQFVIVVRDPTQLNPIVRTLIAHLQRAAGTAAS